eukprot:2726538-Rhodomonas_salina.1
MTTCTAASAHTTPFALHTHPARTKTGQKCDCRDSKVRAMRLVTAKRGRRDCADEPSPSTHRHTHRDTHTEPSPSTQHPHRARARGEVRGEAWGKEGTGTPTHIDTAGHH